MYGIQQKGKEFKALQVVKDFKEAILKSVDPRSGIVSLPSALFSLKGYDSHLETIASSLQSEVRLRLTDNVVWRKIAVILCYTDVPESSVKSRQIENVLIDQLEFDRRNIHIYRDLDMKNLVKLISDLEQVEVQQRASETLKKGKVLFYIYLAAYWEFPSGDNIMALKTQQKINLTERLLGLVENPYIFCVVHLENAYKFKPGQSRLPLEEDKYQFDRYTGGMARLLKIQTPVEKLKTYITEMITVRGVRTFVIPQDFKQSGIITFFPNKEKLESVVIDLRAPITQIFAQREIHKSTIKTNFSIWEAKPITMLMRTCQWVKQHQVGMHLTPKGHLLFTSKQAEDPQKIVAVQISSEEPKVQTETNVCSNEGIYHTDSVYLLESSLYYICINKQDDKFQPYEAELVAFQPGSKKPFQQRYQIFCQGVNLRKLVRFGDYILGLATGEYFIFDSALKELTNRSYSQDEIDGNFGSASLSFDATHLLLLFGGIYFVQLENQYQEEKQVSLLHLVQVHHQIKFQESVYQALEYQSGKILCACWEPGYLILDKFTGESLLRIVDPVPSNMNCRGFWPLPGFDPEHYPFVIARNSAAFNLINVKLGTLQMLIKDRCDSNWYQDTFVLIAPGINPDSPDGPSQTKLLDQASAGQEQSLDFDLWYTTAERGNSFETHLIRKMQFRRDFTQALKDLGSLPFANIQEYKLFNKVRLENDRIEQEREQAKLPAMVRDLQEMVVAQQDEIREMRQSINKLVEMIWVRERNKVEQE